MVSLDNYVLGKHYFLDNHSLSQYSISRKDLKVSGLANVNHCVRSVLGLVYAAFLKIVIAGEILRFESPAKQ